MTQIKWFLLALLISFVLVSGFEGAISVKGIDLNAQNTFLGLNLFLEILIFFVFSIFVVFGIKGYFELYTEKVSNLILSISGALLFFGIFILFYQILNQE
ncbi:hypothetical protein [Flavobacterium restrictum]|jgi:hypothetical protein|uniref:Uncharacterized protein n=1 Tax=Flavobacterium restrictum TaxID=2594428 RepID=A0A553EBB6_9FLAO|nr:hypothetical protein [Flavobacterium restrictum]TRX42357.1 hypothetical protein FNW21_03605 [Flavobacterium restrictum]